jgi:hypothetical protein
MSRFASYFRPRAALMVAAVLVALAVRIKSPAPRERTVDGLAAMLGEAVGGVVQTNELVWESSQSFVSELLFGRHILFLASELPGGPRDVYRARVRLTLDGSPLDVTQVRNLTETPRGDDVALELNGSRAVFATLAFGRIQGISVIETLGVRDDDRPPGVLDRALFSLSSFQRTGSFDGVGRTDIVLDLPARMAHLTLDAGRLAVDFGERGRALVYDLERRLLRGADGGEAYAARALPQVHGPKPLVFWAVDSVRAELGPEPVAWLERVVFGAKDSVRRTTYALFQGDAEARLRTDAEQRTARVLEPSALGGADTWPPPRIPSLWKEPKPGEGEWSAVVHDFLKPAASGQHAGAEAPAPYFYRTSIRPDPERPYSEVLLVAMDMRQLELGMQAGYEDPKPTTGPPGEGRLPRDPAIYRRVVATFNGAFKTTHGEYGMMVNRRVLLPPVPGGASLVVEEGGQVGLGSWPQSDEIPDNLISFRQNLDPLVEDGVPNPTGRQLWGWQLEGKSVMTERTAVCVTPAGHLYYAWGAEIDGKTLGKALRQAGCSYAMHLDMNPGHCGFVFSDIKDPRTGAMTLKVAHEGMKVNPDKYARWSAKDFFYVMLRNPAPSTGPGFEWSSDGGLQPPPAWIPGIFSAKRRMGELEVELVSLERGRVEYRLRSGTLERAAGPLAGFADADSQRVVGAIGLGHSTDVSRYGLFQSKDQRQAFDARYATLLLEDGLSPRVFAPGNVPSLSEGQQAVQLPLLAWAKKLVDRASDRGALRRRGALCVSRGGRVLIAQVEHDSSGPLAQTLLEAGCDEVLELDRGSHHPSFVHRTGTSTPPMSHYEGSALYLLGRPMLPHAFRWKPKGSVPSTKVTSFDVPPVARREQSVD